MTADEPPTSLFSDRARTAPSFAGPEESTWDFLDRVDDPAWARVRGLLERWFAQYPESERADLRGRLASRDYWQFHSAWFELYLYALHRAVGFNVEVHPEVEGVTTHPDFRLSGEAGPLLLEATILGGSDGAGRDARRARVVAAIERIESSDFSLHFHIETETSEAPPMRDVRRRVERWLAGLDWETEHRRLHLGGNAEGVPAIAAEAAGWKFGFRAWPRKAAQRGKDPHTISAGPSDGGVFDHASSLRARLEEKAKKYGSGNGPLVIAVRLDGMGADHEDVEVALLGPQIGVLDPLTATVVPTKQRGEGLWHRDGAVRNQQVVGVLTFHTELRPWSITRQRPTLWLAPGMLAFPTLPYDTMTLGERGFEPLQGSFDPAATFDLPDGAAWPGDSFGGRR